MNNLLSFSRNRCTRVEEISAERMRTVCNLQDTLMDARVEMTVRLPDFEIETIQGNISRFVGSEIPDMNPALQNMVGIRIGAGVRKMIKGLIHASGVSRQLVFMVEECCQAVILAFTKDVLQKTPPEQTAEKEFYINMVKENVRLYNRCAAFAPGSSLLEGIEPPK